MMVRERDDQSGSKRYDKQNLRLEEDGGGGIIKILQLNSKEES